MPTKTSSIYICYGRSLDGEGGTGFYWQRSGTTGWHAFPVVVTDTTTVYKHEDCSDTTIYYTLGPSHGTLSTTRGLVVNPSEDLYLSLSTSATDTDPDPSLDEEVIIGVITVNPHGREFWLLNVPPGERGKGWHKDWNKAWGKGKKVPLLKDLPSKTVDRFEAYAKKAVRLDANVRSMANKAKGRIK